MFNRDVPLFSLDDEDRKLIKKIRAWAIWSLFMRVLIFILVWFWSFLICFGAVYVALNEAGIPPSQGGFPNMAASGTMLGFGIFFLVLWIICLIGLVILDFKIAKHAKVMQKYDSSMNSNIITRYYWAITQNKWILFFFLSRFGIFLDGYICSLSKKILKLKQLTPQEEQAKEEQWLNEYTNGQTNERSINYRLSLRHKDDDSAKLTDGETPKK